MQASTKCKARTPCLSTLSMDLDPLSASTLQRVRAVAASRNRYQVVHDSQHNSNLSVYPQNTDGTLEGLADHSKLKCKLCNPKIPCSHTDHHHLVMRHGQWLACGTTAFSSNMTSESLHHAAHRPAHHAPRDRSRCANEVYATILLQPKVQTLLSCSRGASPSPQAMKQLP